MSIMYTPTELTPRGKSGKMKPDSNGAYDVVLGGLNTFNSEGHWYTLEGSDALFLSSSSFMRNVKEGTLYSEYKHPVRQQGIDDKVWLQRYLGLDSDRFTNTIQEVWLDSTLAKKMSDSRLPKNAVVIMGKIKPYGPMKEYVIDAIENPNQNLCFSIRSMTKNVMRGDVLVKILKLIITFDVVYSGGIAFSKKAFHPSVEGISAYDSDKALDILNNFDKDELTEFATESIYTPGDIITQLKKKSIITHSPIYTGL